MENRKNWEQIFTLFSFIQSTSLTHRYFSCGLCCTNYDACFLLFGCKRNWKWIFTLFLLEKFAGNYLIKCTFAINYLIRTMRKIISFVAKRYYWPDSRGLTLFSSIDPHVSSTCFYFIPFCSIFLSFWCDSSYPLLEFSPSFLSDRKLYVIQYQILPPKIDIE